MSRPRSIIDVMEELSLRHGSDPGFAMKVDPADPARVHRRRPDRKWISHATGLSNSTFGASLHEARFARATESRGIDFDDMVAAFKIDHAKSVSKTPRELMRVAKFLGIGPGLLPAEAQLDQAYSLVRNRRGTDYDAAKEERRHRKWRRSLPHP